LPFSLRLVSFDIVNFKAAAGERFQGSEAVEGFELLEGADFLHKRLLGTGSNRSASSKQPACVQYQRKY
jgi:hypothetical protein